VWFYAGALVAVDFHRLGGARCRRRDVWVRRFRCSRILSIVLGSVMKATIRIIVSPHRGHLRGSTSRVLCVVVYNPSVVTFRPIGPSEFLEKILPLVMVSLFIERALEVFLTSWRQGRTAQLKERAEAAAAKQVPGQPRHADVIALAEHQARTRRIAFVAGTTLGVLLAALGVRLLEVFLEPSFMEAMSLAQAKLLRTTDVLLTGAVLGGGSDALHQLVLVFTNFFQTTAGKVK